ncbi:MAG: mechanosensitive ion channel family protein [Candidatus Nanohalobium sp.]
MALESFLGSQQTLIQLGRFLLTLLIGVFLTRTLLMPLTGRILKKRKDEKTLHSIVNIVGIIGLFLSFTVALQAGNFGNLATIIGAIAAALTFAIGFGMRDQVGNMVSGVFIHFDNPFIKGDYIRVGEVEGVVKDISLRETTVNGQGSEKTVIPNSTLMNTPTKNYTRGRKTKTSIETKIEQDKLDYKTSLLKESAEENQKVLERPGPEVVYRELEDGKMKAELHYWVKEPETAKKIKSQVLETYNRKLEENKLLEEKKE